MLRDVRWERPVLALIKGFVGVIHRGIPRGVRFNPFLRQASGVPRFTRTLRREPGKRR